MDRPPIRCLVAYFSPTFGLLTIPRVISLAEAADRAAMGYAVLVDPADECDLATYERQHRIGVLPTSEQCH